MAKLNGKIELVAGASLGCGHGIALALGEQGATVARKVGITMLGLLTGFMKTERLEMHMQD